MVDESQVYSDQARMRVTSDLSQGAVSSEDIKQEMVRLRRESLESALAIIDRYQARLTNDFALRFVWRHWLM
jgi:hypothetical protein